MTFRMTRVWVLRNLSLGGVTHTQLHEAWADDPYTLDAVLRRLRLEGRIACANGLWYRRNAVTA